jgi:hypothetical protein
MDRKVQDGVHLHLARNAYLPVRSEGTNEAFKIRIMGLCSALKEDVRKAQAKGGKYDTSGFDSSWDELVNNSIMGQPSLSSQIKQLWLNQEFIRTAAQVATLGEHFQNAKIFEATMMGTKVNKIYGAVSFNAWFSK